MNFINRISENDRREILSHFPQSMVMLNQQPESFRKLTAECRRAKGLPDTAAEPPSPP